MRSFSTETWRTNSVGRISRVDKAAPLSTLPLIHARLIKRHLR